MKIVNDAKLNEWLHQRMQVGHDLHAIKGPAPDGATYSDGEPIRRQVNVAWRDIVTGEVFKIEYAGECNNNNFAEMNALDALVDAFAEARALLEPLVGIRHCQAGCDGECNHPQCPQRLDGEPEKSGRFCPLPHWTDDPEW